MRGSWSHRWQQTPKRWLHGALLALGAVIFGGLVVYPAIQEISGLAVAQSGSRWNNVRDGAAGDNLTSGTLAAQLYGFDGTNFDRVRAVADNTARSGAGLLALPCRANAAAPSFSEGAAVPCSTDLAGNTRTAVSGSVTANQGTPAAQTNRWPVMLSDGTNFLEAIRALNVTPIQHDTLHNVQAIGTAGNPVSVSITGVGGQRVHVYSITGNCAPAGTANLVVQDGAATIWQTSAGTVTTTSYRQTFNPGLTISTGATATIAVTTCGGGNNGYIAVQADQF